MTQEEKQLLLQDLCARLPEQEWRIIPDYPEYAVSNKGNIATLKTGKLRKFSDHKGYKQCMLRKDGKAYSIMQSTHYDYEKKQYLPSIDFYVDDNL